jgi:hypothetical protein
MSLQERDWQKQQCNEETQMEQTREQWTHAHRSLGSHTPLPLWWWRCVPGPGFFFSFFYVAKFSQLAKQKNSKWLKICGFFRFLVAKFRDFIFFNSFLKNRQISLLDSSIKPKINSPIFPQNVIFFS